MARLSRASRQACVSRLLALRAPGMLTAERDHRAGCLQRQKGANTAFKKAGVTYAPKQSERHRGLRGLKQESFKSVLAWSETKCKNYLMTLQVLGSARGRLCYACRSPLHATSAKKVLRCKNSDCTRPRGAAADYKGFVSTCYCFAVKAAADTAMHLTGKSEDYVDRVYTQCRYVCAFAQWKRSHGMEFPAGVVEVDCNGCCQGCLQGKSHKEARSSRFRKAKQAAP
ncbi:unnamed protein product [Effrenium voratum]|nr:unnamed protein product [Effrenium voratum]